MKNISNLPMIRQVLLQATLVVVISIVLGCLMFKQIKLPTGSVRQTNSTVEDPIEVISFEQFREGALDGSIVCIDARSVSEFEKGRVPGAISLPLDDFDHAVSRNLELFLNEKPIAIYCSGKGCDLSHTLARKLTAIGVNRVSIFSTGWNQWKSAGLPIEP